MYVYLEGRNIISISSSLDKKYNDGLVLDIGLKEIILFLNSHFTDFILPETNPSDGLICYKGITMPGKLYAGFGDLEAGTVYLDGENLYKCLNNMTSISGALEYHVGENLVIYTPSESDKINIIDYRPGVILYKDKIYRQYGIIYRCIRDSEIPIMYDLKDLIGNYVTPYSSADGSIDNPIAYSSGMILYNGKYYTEDGVKYLCNRDTEIPVYNSLKDLVNLYVVVVE